LNARVTAVSHDGHAVRGVEIEDADGGRLFQPASNVVSTMPLTHLVKSLGRGAPASVEQATRDLKYRDFITVAVVVDRAELFPDNWIYVHDPSVKVGRIQNFKNWSADMVPDQSKTCLGLEYFCSRGDDISSLSNAQLVELAKTELEAIGLVQRQWIVDATVRAGAECVSRLRRGLRAGVEYHPRVRVGIREPADHRPQRHAHLQQPGPLDGDGDAGGAEPAR
jgi:protoporphyrinogen oxidase